MGVLTWWVSRQEIGTLVYSTNLFIELQQWSLKILSVKTPSPNTEYCVTSFYVDVIIVCTLLHTQPPLTVPAPESTSQHYLAVILPAMGFCGLKLSKLFSKQARVILHQHLNKPENNGGENIVKMNEKEKLICVSQTQQAASLHPASRSSGWQCLAGRGGLGGLISATVRTVRYYGEADNITVTRGHGQL